MPQNMPQVWKWGKSEENGASFQDFTRESRCGKSPQSPQSPPNGANLRGGESLQMGKRKWGKLGKIGQVGEISRNQKCPKLLKILPKWGKKCHRFRRMPHFEKNGANGEKMPQVGEIQDSDPRFKRGYLAVSLLDSIGLDCCFICIAEQDPVLRIL